MNIRAVTSSIRLDREFQQLLVVLDEQINAKKKLPIAVSGLSDGALISAAVEMTVEICEKNKKTVLCFADNEKECRRLASCFEEAGLSVATYPYRDFVMYPITASHDHDRERLSVLYQISRGMLDVVVTTPAAALQYTMPSERLLSCVTVLESGAIFDLDDLCRRLVLLGYVSVDTVEGVGQFSRRGGILDVFVCGEAHPIRMEFFGDEIDRIGYFDMLSQRMIASCESIRLLPALEVVLDEDSKRAIEKKISLLLKKSSDENAEILSRELSMLESGQILTSADKYIRAIYPDAQNLLSYLSAVGRNADACTPIFMMGTSAVQESLSGYFASQREMVAMLLEKGLVTGEWASYEGDEEGYRSFCEQNAVVHLNSFAGDVGQGRLAGLFGFRCRRGVSYAGKLELFIEDLRSFVQTSYRILVLAENASSVETIERMLTDEKMTVVRLDKNREVIFDDLKVGVVYIAEIDFSVRGFELLAPRTVVLVPNDTEEQRSVKRRRKQVIRRKDAGERIMSYAELKPGDYVVHDAHGIGQFVGMEKLYSDGSMREYITIRYAGTDKLFLPAERIEAVSKYIGSTAEDGTVKLSKLGGTDWQKAKMRAKSAAKDIAKDLIALYAARQRRKGYAFPTDSALESEFDDGFSYEETDAQMAAIAEIKADMARPIPMDRLLCGDVGYGKTEVALRAAFKAVVAGKQVAILVPTTILALQHYQTVLSRMRGYAVSVDMLSRFRKPKEQAEILRRLKRGALDIIIGTHSLLGSRVEFKDLGLLIVDEEQRFGVAQKERIKNMAQDVDVLTLTATPIPRTLNMAMSGIRDMSLLDEAPNDRYPVQTYVLEHNDGMIAEAIRREVGRGGQVLYLYNRVESIASVAGKISKNFPSLHVVFAHGKMEREELEDIWQEMVEGKIDVLVCTTIIETGVDLPNANTLIIENADRMGLSQLHQLRGRVGRSGRHAYAYFTYRTGKVLSEIAMKRLEAVREYAGFGAGFRIALRDMELRGAGNLLGAEQHGHIESVGYDMYIRLLNEAVLEERGEVKKASLESAVSFVGDAYIPENYVSSSAQRMDMYKKISLIATEQDLRDVLDEFCDRFGDPPVSVMRLLYSSLCRALASSANILRVEQHDRDLHFISKELNLEIWSELFAENATLRYVGGVTPYIRCKLPAKSDAAEYACRLIGRMSELSRDLQGKQKGEPSL